jgi:DNA-directed RNA polymerase specialized sigma24 family protein
VSPAGDVRAGALDEVRGATEQRAVAEREWREAIREASAKGCSMSEIATVAGVSKGRVHQIVRAADG